MSTYRSDGVDSHWQSLLMSRRRIGTRTVPAFGISHPQNMVPPPPAATLSAHGAEIPVIGFGTSTLGDCGDVVATALRLGYRHIDTARKYGTERGVGAAIRASGVAREQIFVTTKVS